ncbi:MAG: CHASE2 domain-containing protein [Kiloniellales bacterium]
MDAVRAYRRWIVAGSAGAALATTLAVGGPIGGDGLLYDLMIAARAMAGPAHPASDERSVAVIVLDRRSLDAPELAAVPRVLLGPYWARLLDGVMTAGARAVGFDMIFAYNTNRIIADHEQPFLAALSRHRERVVLARSAPTPVAAPFFYAMGAGRDPNALGYVEIQPDPGGVHRRVPLRFEAEQEGVRPSLAGALLARAGIAAPPEAILLAPRRPLQAMPAYSVIDVLRCAEHDSEALKRAFAGRTLLIGTALPEEDRRVAVDRFLPAPAPDTRPPPAEGKACELQRAGASAPGSGTVPGVFIHAAAVATVSEGRLVRISPPAVIAVMSALAAAAGAAIAFAVRPWTAVAGMLAGQSGLFALGTGSLGLGLWLPWVAPGVALAGSVATAYVARYLFEERRRHRLQRAFGHYLAPSLVTRLAESEAALKLGGETREVTIMFADLIAFTERSAGLEPQQVMSAANRYLGIVADIVEETGGYVDKFIGDCVMAIWGAPAAAADHAVQAVEASRRAVAAVLHERAAAEARGEIGFTVRIGVNSGAAIVGNVGTERRTNFTAVGQTVNVAARLEGVPDAYGCYVVIGADTARLVGDRYLLCELDRVRLKGVAKPLSVFEPLAFATEATPELGRYAERYAAALAAYRGRRFAEAAAAWRALDYPGPARTNAGGAALSPPRIMAERAAHYASRPPADDWDGVWA